jgi:hypothetical protein
MTDQLLHEITLDIDLEYSGFIRSYECLDLKAQVRTMLGRRCGLNIRRSATGRTHARIFLEHEITFYDSLRYRAVLGDDAHRIKLDLSRMYEYGDLEFTGRLFDEKLVKGKICKAGTWHAIKF